MNAKTTATIAVAVVALMVFAVAGATTYSWFSDSQDTDITVSTAVIDVDVVVDGMKSEDGKYSAEINNVAANWVFNETPLSYKIINKSSIDTAVRTYVDVSIIDADKKSLSDVDAIKDVKENFVLQFGKESTDMESYGLVNGRTVLNDWAVNSVGVADDTYYFNLYTSEAFETQGLTIEIVIVTEALQVDAPREIIVKETEDATIDDVFKDAVTENIENIVVELTGDVTYDVAPWAKDAMGGEITKTITINGNGHKVTFNQTDSDWNNIVTNGAKLILNDMEITSSGYNDGPWNRHDLNFACDVEMNDVFSDKALAFKAGATLKNVTIDDPNTSDTYAIWIQPRGQTVSLDGCTIDMIDCTDGRGIKIDNQYLSSADEAKVTLNVKDTIFKTEEKSAILVKSTVGADINIENVDIKEVKADKFFTVWVDEDAAQYADLVTVVGGAMKVEGTDPFNVQGANITLPNGNYNVLPKIGSNLTIKADGCRFTGVSDLNINGSTVIGATFFNSSGRVVTGTIDGIFKDCKFIGSSALRYCYAGETVVFENCTFSGDVYGIHFDGGDNDVTFKNCTFSGFNAMGSAIPKLIMESCTFKSNGISGYNGINLWGCTEMINCEFVFDGTASTEWIDVISGGSFTGCTVSNGSDTVKIEDSEDFWSRNDVIVTVDGLQFDTGLRLFLDDAGNYLISDSEDMFSFASGVNDLKRSFSGKTVLLNADVDLKNRSWTPIGQTGATEFKGIFDGQGHTISNLVVDSSSETGKTYSSGIFGWIESHGSENITVKNLKVDGANVTGHHNVAVIAGYSEGSAVFENISVKNATVTNTHYDDDACGDKAGIIVGYTVPSVKIKECSAIDCKVYGARDAGQLIGCLIGSTDNLYNNTATNVSVERIDSDICSGKNINEALIGRTVA